MKNKNITMLAPINPKHTFHMKKTFIILCFIPIVSFCQVQNILFDAKILESPIENATKLTAPFNYLEIPVYELPVNKKYVVLNNDYEEIKIKNGDNRAASRCRLILFLLNIRKT